MCIRCEKDGLVLKYPIGLTRNELVSELKYSKSTVKGWMRKYPGLKPISARTINRRPQYLYSAYEVACWLNHVVFKDLRDKMERADEFRKRYAELKKKGGPEFEKMQAEIAQRKASVEAQRLEYLAKKAGK